MKRIFLTLLLIGSVVYLAKNQQDTENKSEFIAESTKSSSGKSDLSKSKTTAEKVEVSAATIKNIEESSKPQTEILFESISTGEIEKISYLIDKGVDLETRDEYGNTALLKSFDEGKLEIAKLLLEKGADPLVKNREGLAVATAAALQFESELFKEMVEKGAAANPPILGKMNLLMNLAMEGHSEMVSFISNKEPEEINNQDEFGNTALHYAVQGGHTEVVEVLINHKAEVTIRNSKGLSALDVAKKDGYTKIIDLLSKAE